MKKRIVHISANPIALFVGAVAFLYSLITTIPVYLQLIQFAEADILYEVVGLSHSRIILAPVIFLIGGYVLTFLTVVLYNLLAKFTGDISIEIGEHRNQRP